MSEELLASLTEVVRQLHLGNLERLEAQLDSDHLTPLAVTMLARELPQPDQREALSILARHWQKSFPAVSARDVLASLKALRYSAKRQSRAELCWSGPVISLQGFRSTAEAYRELIATATRSALIVSFALGEVESLRDSLENAILRGVQVRFILEDFNVMKQESWRAKFVSLGATILSNSTIFVWPTSERRVRDGRVFGSMHVKCLVVDEASLLLTSANWSSAAMEDNMELGVIISGPGQATSVVHHFDHLIAAGTLTEIPES